MMNNNKMIDWHIGDLEQRFGFKGGKYTDVNSWFVLLLTFVITAVFFIGLCYLPSSIRSTKAIAMILERGWTPYAMVVLFVLALMILFVKWRKLAFQKKAFRVELIPSGDNFALTPQTALEVIAVLNESVDDPKRFVLFNRIERALLNLKNVGNVSDVSEMLRSQAENDESHMDSSYGILSGIIWVIPILGFIGTVIGLSGAIGGFGAVLSADTTVSSLRESLSPVTGSLGIAFDTTFVALLLAMVIQMLMTLLRKQEESFLDACRDYAHVNVISRLRMTR
jgi:biopolymer transport protein ExbB/TolQ